jgi:ABC-type amino acid transport system permease subunit
MASSGLDILFDGTNLSRILGGMWLAAKISLASLVIGLLLGVLFGILRTSHSRGIQGISSSIWKFSESCPCSCCYSFFITFYQKP